MRSLKVNYQNGRAVVDFSAESVGVHALKHRVVATLLNDIGSDKTYPSRGTSLDASLMQSNVFDAVGVQHALNFATVKATKYFRTENPEAVDKIATVLTGTVPQPTNQIGVRLSNAGSRFQTAITVTNKSGETVSVVPT